MKQSMSRIFSIALTAFGLATAADTPSAEAQFEQSPLWRIQVRVHTCDESNAGTDDYVSVRFNDQHGWALGRRFPKYLENPGNDRQRNATEIWDVPVDGVATVADIHYLELRIDSSDRWCFDRVELILNGNTGGWGGNVYNAPSAVFVRSSADRIRISTGGASSYRFSYDDLRWNGSWNLSSTQARVRAAPARIMRPQLELMLRGLMSTFIANNPVKWGGLNGSSYVDVTRSTVYPSTVHVDLDMERALGVNVDVDYELHAPCLVISGGPSVDTNHSDVSDSTQANFVKDYLTTLGGDGIIALGDGLGDALRNAGRTTCSPSHGFDVSGNLNL